MHDNPKRSILALAVVAALATFLTGPSAEAVGIAELKVGKFALEKGVFNTIFAKELCSCQFVNGLTLQECEARDNLPAIAHKLVNLTVDKEKHTVNSSYKGADEVRAAAASLGFDLVTIGGPAEARFDDEHPEWGCVLTKLPSETP